jgi:hypothetical protein
LFECDKYIPEILEPVNISNAPTSVRNRLGLDKCFVPDASGYGHHLTISGSPLIANSPDLHYGGCDFDLNSTLRNEGLNLTTD